MLRHILLTFNRHYKNSGVHQMGSNSCVQVVKSHFETRPDFEVVGEGKSHFETKTIFRGHGWSCPKGLTPSPAQNSSQIEDFHSYTTQFQSSMLTFPFSLGFWHVPTQGVPSSFEVINVYYQAGWKVLLLITRVFTIFSLHLGSSKFISDRSSLEKDALYILEKTKKKS